MSAGRVLYVDAGAGASGDMILGALVDLGVPVTRIRGALETLPLPGWRMISRRIERAGLTARKIDVRVDGHSHGRGWREIRKIVDAGDLDAAVRRRALTIFRRLIEAEAEVHGTPPDKVHLHEVGATDAIVDVIGACVGLEALAPGRIVVSPMTTGHGTVRCAHGLYPVPAPATLRLVRDAPVRAGEVEGERLTPTGAAILTTVADAWGPLPAMRPRAVGYGAGDRVMGDDPNFLLMVLGDVDPGSVALESAHGPEVTVIQFNVDDASPQVLAYAVESLFREGALEVYTTAVQMKKGRAGHEITVLAPEERLEALASVILRETTTLGMRYRKEGRIELQRSVSRVRTPHGAVRVKVGHVEGRPLQAWPEYEDCAAVARRSGVPLKEIQQLALEAWRTAAARRRRRAGRRK